MTLEKFDVAVVGGGPSGTMAAIAAARNGAKVILIESQGYLGGMLTAAGVAPMMSFHAGETLVVRGIPDEMVQRMKARGWSTGHIADSVGYCSSITPFDTEGMKVVMEEMAQEAGVTLLYHAVMTGADCVDGSIKAVRLHTKGGELVVEADVFVDATADADLAMAAGATCIQGRESDGLTQPMTLKARVYNVDTAKMKEFLLQNPQETYAKDNSVVENSVRGGISGAYTLINRAMAEGEINYSREAVLCFETNTPGEYVVNMTRIAKLSAVDAFDLTKAEIEGRKQVHETIAFLRARIPGFENCVLSYTGPNIGVRESRRLVGVKTLTGQELLENVMFDDAVAMGGYPIDIHSPEGAASGEHGFMKPGSWYSIPYSCMISEKCSNLIVSGRCISASHDALAAVRVTPIAMAIGQAGGTAAAMAATQSVDVDAVNTDALREKLSEQGAFLTPYVRA